MKLNSNKTGLASYLRSHEHLGGIIVCERLKFIYMKPTKTAGTSILRSVLEKKVPGIFHYKDQPERFQEWVNRITDEELKKYFIFSVARNPWDRLVSTATYLNIDFKDFIKNIDEYWKDENVKIHSLPLHLYTHNNDKLFVDFVCRFECLQPDINIVFDYIGEPRHNLPVVNKSKHKHYSLYYSDYEIERVEEIYKLDIKYFGYNFEVKAKKDSMPFLKRFINYSK